jgi:hypothetical protein
VVQKAPCRVILTAAPADGVADPTQPAGAPDVAPPMGHPVGRIS